MTQTTLSYRLSFNTPAFLGNAEQQAQWRTPPIKALIRQWWRVVKAPDVAYNHHALLAAEKRLFGAAGEKGQPYGRSQVLLRLGHWNSGSFMPLPGEMVNHDESPIQKVAANTYLGYGPLGTKNNRTALEPEKAQNTLRLQVQDETAAAELRQAIQLAAWFGGVGSRSRNAFGSMHWQALADTPALLALSGPALNEHGVCLPFTQALARDWPHAIGTDALGHPLVWQSKTLHPTWMAAMRELAVLKIGLRTSEPFKFNNGGKSGHPQPLPRHVLAYPAGGNHMVNAADWGKNGRLANQLRLHLHREGEGKNLGFRGVIVHLPCGVPSFMRSSVRLPDERQVWESVHRYLDNLNTRPELPPFARLTPQ